MVFPAPVDAVRLEGIAAVRDEEHNPPARSSRRRIGTSQHTHHLTRGERVVLDVFEHLVAEDQVKSGIGVGQLFPRRVDDTRGTCAGLAGTIEVVFQPEDPAAEEETGAPRTCLRRSRSPTATREHVHQRLRGSSPAGAAGRRATRRKVHRAGRLFRGRVPSWAQLCHRTCRLLPPVDGDRAEHAALKSHLRKPRLTHHVCKCFCTKKVFSGINQVRIIFPASRQPQAERGDNHVHMNPDQRREQIAGGPASYPG